MPPSRMSVPRPAMFVETVTAPLRPGLRHDMRFAFVIFGVQHFVLNAHLLQDAGEMLRFLNGNGAHQNGLAFFVQRFDFFGGVAKLLVFGAIDDVRILDADHLLVRRDHRHVKVVNLLEFGLFSVGGTGHARQLLVHAEEVLEGDAGQRLRFALDLDVFFGFDRLVQTIAPAAAGHQTAGEFVNDDDLSLLHHVIAVALVKNVRAQTLLHVVIHLNIGRIIQIAGIEKLLYFEDAFFGQRARCGAFRPP